MEEVDEIKDFIQENKPIFKDWEKYIKSVDWSEMMVTKTYAAEVGDIKKVYKYYEERDKEFRVQTGVVNNILLRLTRFIKKEKKDYKNLEFKRFYKYSLGIINTHIKRYNTYFSNCKFSECFDGQKEIEYQETIHSAISKIKDELKTISYVEDEDKPKDLIEFYEDKKASLAVYKEVMRDFPFVRKKIESMKIDFDSPPPPTLHILNENPPIWDSEKNFWEQEKGTIQYYIDELKKIEYGVEIDGYFFDGWLYFHINHFVTPIPHTITINGIEENEDRIIVPPLRDNEVVMTDYFIKAKNDQGYALVAATRRAAKTTLNASRVERAKLIGRRQILVAGGSPKDLGQIEDNCRVYDDNCNPAFKLYYLVEDDKGGKEYGIRTKDNKKKRHTTAYFINLEAGVKKTKTEILAGFTPDEFILDEAFKFHFASQLEGLEPALFGQGVMRCIPMMTACVCAGTKVWDNKGNLVNIEDLQKEDGIIGFDLRTETVSKENITWMKPPIEKECYKITTITGRTLECSYDHPILKKHRNKIDFSKGRNRRFRAMTFEETHTLKVGDNIATIEEVPIFGDKRMWNPRLVGMLIGDGSYGFDKTPILSNCDEDINKYIDERFDTVVEKSTPTKDGRLYRETRIKDITKQLRELGIYGQTKSRKTLPLNIHSYHKEDICEMIAGLFDTDGCVHVGKTNMNITLSSSSDILLKEIQLLLQKLGIHSRIDEIKPSKSGFGKNVYYRLAILDRNSILKFKENITLLIKYKQDNLDKMYNIYFKRSSGAVQKYLKGLRFERIKSIEKIGIKKVYNLTAGVTHTYVANGIVTHNTGGDDDLAADGIKMLNHPEDNKVTLMDWDKFEEKVPEQYRTWNKKPFGLFLPGQMSTRFGEKIYIPFNDYLGIEKEDAPTLSKLKIGVTDWENTTKKIHQEREEKASDKKKYVKFLAYHPLTPEDIFMSGKENPFPVQEAKAHRRYLEETGLWDARKEIYRDTTGKIKIEPSKRELIPYPFKGISDAPALIFELPPPKDQIPYGMYTAGFDDYKQDDSDTDSVATFYVWKNIMLGDKWSKRIVASLSIRPDKHREVWEKWLLLMELYNLMQTAFGENEDFRIKDFLESRKLADYYLAPNLNFTQSFTITNNRKRDFGWTPRTTKKFLMDLFIDYCNEEHEVELEDGSIKIYKGVQLIDDIYLLDEIINYNEHANVDRIIGAIGGLGYIHYLNASRSWNSSKNYKKDIEEKEQTQITFKKSFYANNLRGTYGNIKRR